MDQALTTLRIAWRRRALFVRPLAVPLALVALVTLLQPAIDGAAVDLAGTFFSPGTVGFAMLGRLVTVLPYLLIEAVAVAMIVALVGDSASAARWLPDEPALQLAAVTAATLAAMLMLLVVARWEIHGWAITFLTPEMIERQGPLLRLMYFVVDDVDWVWPVAIIPAIVAARQLFPRGAAHASAPRPGRFAVAVLLVLVVSTAIGAIERALLTWIFSALGDAGALPVIGQIPDAAASAAAMAVVVPIIAMAIAVAAFAGRTAAQAPR
jgi:hypothetical protein